MDAYAFFLISSSDQHPSFVLRCPRSSHRCPRPLLRMPRTDLALVQAETGCSASDTGLAYPLPEPTAGTGPFSECLSVPGRAGLRGV